MIHVERRRGVEFGRRAEVWSTWKRLEETRPWIARLCGIFIAALVFSSFGALVGWVLSHSWHWVEWKRVEVLHSMNHDGKSELVVELDYRLKVSCDRLRLTAPWSLVAFYPDQNVSVALPTTPSDELIAHAGDGSGRVRVLLGGPLERGVKHELSLGLICMQDANGGTVHDADPEVIIKDFIP